MVFASQDWLLPTGYTHVARYLQVELLKIIIWSCHELLKEGLLSIVL
jgi:hypothetical protein